LIEILSALNLAKVELRLQACLRVSDNAEEIEKNGPI